MPRYIIETKEKYKFYYNRVRNEWIHKNHNGGATNYATSSSATLDLDQLKKEYPDREFTIEEKS